MLFNSTKPTQGPPEDPQFAEAVLDHAGLLIVVADRQGRIVRFNPACEKISGLNFAGVRGRLLWELVNTSEAQSRIKEMFTRLVQEEQPFFQYTDAWNAPDGQPSWITWTITAIPDAGGQLAYLVAVGQDVTAAHYQQQQAAETQARYRTLVEQIPAVTYIAAMDEYTSSIYYSPQVEAMLGYTPEEMVSQPDLWMQMIHPDDRERVYAEISQRTGNGKSGLTSGLK